MLRILPQNGRADINTTRDLCLRIRAAKRWTQGQLAQRLGVSRKAIEKIEQRATQTAPRTIFLALKKIGEEVGEEVGGES